MLFTATSAPAAQPATDYGPVRGFSGSHEGLLAVMRKFPELPALQDAARRARVLAQQILELFDEAVQEHHSQEEDQLFDAVQRAARRGEEADRVRLLVDRLTHEHRRIEAQWALLRPMVRHAAAGRPCELPAEAVAMLVQAYGTHAEAEEREFLPLAAEILGRNGNQMAALGLALHMRHAYVPPAHI